MKNLVWVPLLALVWLATGAAPLRSPKDQPSLRVGGAPPALPPLPPAVVSLPHTNPVVFTWTGVPAASGYWLYVNPSSWGFQDSFWTTNWTVTIPHPPEDIWPVYGLRSVGTNGAWGDVVLFPSVRDAGPNTNTIMVLLYLDSTTNLPAVWTPEWTQSVTLTLSNQPASKMFRVRGGIKWN